MTTPESAATEAATTIEGATAEVIVRPTRQGPFPDCPPRELFPVTTGFITPGSDSPGSHTLDASVLMDVYDPTEFVGPGKFERIRVVETDGDFLIEVNWCICGTFAASICGCWDLKFYLDDVDGVGKSSGRLPLEGRVSVDSVPAVPGTNDDLPGGVIPSRAESGPAPSK